MTKMTREPIASQLTAMCMHTDGPNTLCIKHRAAATITELLEAAEAVLYHDERGQGVGYSEAMTGLAAAIAKTRGEA